MYALGISQGQAVHKIEIEDFAEVGVFVSLHLHAAPQHVEPRSVALWPSEGRFWSYRTGAMQDLGYELPRILIPRTPVNKGKKEDRSLER